MKKVSVFILSICIALLLCPAKQVYADEPDYSDTDYWNNLCTSRDLSDAEQEACEAYSEYLKSSSSNLNDQLEALRAQQEDIKNNIAEYGLKIQDYQGQIDTKQVEINNMVAQIEAKQKEIEAKQLEIEAKQKEIDETQAQIDAANEKIKTRMEISQSSMRLNKFTDILMGADSFEEFLRISNGLSAISQYDQKILDDMKELRAKLNSQREEMEVAKAELQAEEEEMENTKQMLEEQQNSIILMQEEVKLVRAAAMEEEAKIRSQSEQVASNIAELNSMMIELARAGQLDDAIITTNGWTYPVPGAYRSAGTWSYDGYGAYPHLGYDFAATVGTTIVAVGNGVILASANGCPTYGYLGNWCGTAQGGAAGGGNQVYELTVVNGSLYGVCYCHMMLDSPIAAGTVVSAGDYVGRVGSAGNSTGPHCHVEIMYLGDGSDFSYYAQHWNGDFSFGCGWVGWDRKCDAGYGAPCRIRPETVFGY
ncbi:MAG: peptidoglycan DD-metalloendopeptidase family protein [Solobacterium sp.]|nr:peptidoglycan DD-metalloendopeptidase family protein [Solobacterium sp.]